MRSSLKLILFGNRSVAPPATPTGLVATGGTGSIIWNWTATPGATSYDLLYSLDGGSNYLALTTGVLTNTYTDSSAQSHVNASGISFVKVRANGPGGSSAYGPGASGTEYITAWGIIDWWNLSDVNAAIGTDTLTNNNSVTFTTGKIGNAATMVSASSQYLNHVSNSGLQAPASGDFFVAGWHKATTLVANQQIAGKFRTNGTNSREYQLSYNFSSNRYQWTVSDVNTGTHQTSVSANTFGAPSTGTYNFVIGYRDSVNNVLKISVNGGAFDSTAYAFTAYQGDASFSIGGSDNPTDFVNGQVDSVVFGKNQPGGIAAIATTIRDLLYNSGNGRAAPFNG